MTNAQLDHEVKIEWEKEPDQFDYVRVSTRIVGTRQKGVPAPVGVRIGYSVLSDNAINVGRPGTFQRRVFWLKEHDRAFEPMGVYENGAPAEAIDPTTVEPGKQGSMTDTAWNG